MDDAIKIFGIFLAMGSAGSLVYAAVAFTSAFVKRFERGQGGMSEELESELADLRARLEDSDQLRLRVAELEERLDFAERLLAQRREAERLGGGEA
jgi:hypothetical protein